MRLLHNFPHNRRPATWDKIDDPTVLLEKEFVRPPVGRILWTRKLEDILLQDTLENMSNVGNDSASAGKTNCPCQKFLTISRWWVAEEAWLRCWQQFEKKNIDSEDFIDRTNM